MKKIIAIIFTIIIAVLAVLFVSNRIKNKYNYKIETIGEYKYFIYRENDLYGVIDNNAQTIIQAKYSEVVIPNPRNRYFYML